MAKTYYEKLQDPEWQEVRRVVIERDDFTCQDCGEVFSGFQGLTVHHGFYARNCEPWEYPLETLWTLCWECHKSIQKETEVIHEKIAQFSGDELAALGELLNVLLLASSQREMRAYQVENSDGNHDNHFTSDRERAVIYSRFGAQKFVFNDLVDEYADSGLEGKIDKIRENMSRL